jgi:UDP-N-acetylglucosamine:LPS N-acetylglucosamine transferase
MSNGKISVIVVSGKKNRFFPALSVALELRRRSRKISLVWVGKGSRREQELCRKYRIALWKSELSSDPSKKTGIHQMWHGLVDMYRFIKIFGKNKPGAVVAFGAEECLPVLAAARLRSVPYYLYEFDSVPSRASTLFSQGARHVFLGLPLAGHRGLHGCAEWTGVPVRPVLKDYMPHHYPHGFEKGRPTILIGNIADSDGSANSKLINIAKGWASDGIQILWQCGVLDYERIRNEMRSYKKCFVQAECGDFYPYYAVSKIVICRPDSWMLSEIAYFGLPCLLLTLSSQKDHYHYINAGVVDMQGWGKRVVDEQNQIEIINRFVRNIIDNNEMFEMMSRRALDNAPSNALAKITGTIVNELTKEN